MAQELNFDELDHAVNQYMQKKTDKPVNSSLGQRATIPAPSTHPQSVGPRPVAVSVPPRRSDVSAEPHQAPAPAHNPHDVSHAEDRPAMRIAPRRAIAPRPMGNRPATFHDIAPPRRAPAVASVHIQPTSPSNRPFTSRSNVLSSDAALESSRPVASRFTDIAPTRSDETPVEPAKQTEPEQPFREAEIKEEASAKVLGGSEDAFQSQASDTPIAEEPTVTQEDNQSDNTPVVHAGNTAPDTTFGTSANWSDAEASEEPSQEPAVGANDNLGDMTADNSSDKQINTADTFAPETAETPAVTAPEPDLSSLDKITARPPQQPALSFNETPQVQPEAKTEWPSTAGLLDTGELHTPARLPADEKGMNHQNKATMGQVFDTKPYHSPIQGGNSGMSAGRTAIIVTLIVVFVLIAAVAVFMYVS